MRFGLLRNRNVALVVLVAIFSQAGMALINALLAFFLARHFGGVVFNEYVAITSIVLAISQLSKGIQATTATEFAKATRGSDTYFHSGDLSALFVGLSLSAAWIGLSPFLTDLLDISYPSVISASLLLTAATIGYRAAGKFQGQRKFTKWQLATLLTSSLQVPLIALVFFLGAPLSVFILLLTVPSIGLFFWSTSAGSGLVVRSSSKRLVHTFASSLMAASSALGLQMPLLLLKHHYSKDLVAALTAISLLLTMLVGLATTFGSFLLPRFVSNPLQKSSYRIHLLTSLPSFIVVLALPFAENLIVPFLFGKEYNSPIPTIALVGISLSYMTWTVAGSVIQERMGSVTLLRSLVFACAAATQGFVMGVLQMPIRIFYLVHLVFGASNLIMAYLVKSHHRES